MVVGRAGGRTTPTIRDVAELAGVSTATVSRVMAGLGSPRPETAAAVTLFFTSAKGIPVSTTHTITGAIVGVGSSQRLSAVRWGVAGRVVWAWILTIPGAAIVSALTYFVVAAVS